MKRKRWFDDFETYARSLEFVEDRPRFEYALREFYGADPWADARVDSLPPSEYQQVRGFLSCSVRFLRLVLVAGDCMDSGHL